MPRLVVRTVGRLQRRHQRGTHGGEVDGPGGVQPVPYRPVVLSNRRPTAQSWADGTHGMVSSGRPESGDVRRPMRTDSIQ
ncbi:hypothetical protein GCM10010279_29260 [Streptomyces mutabilis]|nr:hypothetical protein GCM10010279_29260 [Streptomyces mutabilis]